MSTYRLKRLEFYHSVIGDIAFLAYISREGPYLLASRGKVRLGGAPLGPMLNVMQLRGHPKTLGADWTICKYFEPRIPLLDLGMRQVSRVVHEFGAETSLRITRAFDRSPAGLALKEWVVRHPKLAAAHAHWDTHSLGWATIPMPEVRPEAQIIPFTA